MSHESIKYFDSIEIETKKDFDIPDIYYGLYQNIIAISQFNHEAHLFCNTIDKSSNIDTIESILNAKKLIRYLILKKLVILSLKLMTRNILSMLIRQKTIVKEVTSSNLFYQEGILKNLRVMNSMFTEH